MQEILKSFAGTTVLSAKDLNGALWQVEMDMDSWAKTAFNLPYGLYQFKVMSFGL